MENNTSSIQLRAYGKGELALLYFPAKSTRAARKQLNIWIARNPSVLRVFRETGFRPEDKFYTPRQVEAITHYLGTPEGLLE